MKCRHFFNDARKDRRLVAGNMDLSHSPIDLRGLIVTAADAELDELDDDAAADDEEEEDEGPDLLLRETARIVADMAELGADIDLLKQQFAQLSESPAKKPELP